MELMLLALLFRATTFTALESQVPAVAYGETANTATITFTWNATDENWDITNGATTVAPDVSTPDLTSIYGITLTGTPQAGTAEEFTVKLTGTINDREAVSESGGESTLERAAAVEEKVVVTVTDESGNTVSANNFEFKFADSVASGTLTGTIEVDSRKAVLFHIGANEGQNTSLSINSMDAESLGVNALDLTSQETADAAITTIDNAISKVSSQRAALGAMQNRLEHTINNLGTASENLSAAESRIRDVDMAKENDGVQQEQHPLPSFSGDAGSGQLAASERTPAATVSSFEDLERQSNIIEQQSHPQWVAFVYTLHNQ
jgi:flagellin-like hook-associated protein FlgL